MDHDDSDQPDAAHDPYTRVPARARETGKAWPQRRKVGSTLHVWQRLEIVQRMLASGMPPSSVTTALMAEHGVGRHEAEHYQAVVRARWKSNAAHEDGEQEFLRLKAIVQQAIADASQRKITVRTGTDEDTKEPIFEVVEQPDSKAVIAGAALWARMIGRLDPPERQLPAGGEGTQAPGAGIVLADGTQVTGPIAVDAQDAAEELRRRRAASGKP